MRRCAATLPICFILLFIGVNQVFGQYYQPPRKLHKNIQTVYFELFGNGIFFSLNYDVVFKSHLGTRFGAGFDFSGIPDNNSWFTSDPNYEPFKSVSVVIMENYYVGNGRTRLELGLGGVLGHVGSDITTSKDIARPPGLTFTTGLRILPSEAKHFSFKIAFTPIIAKGRFFPYGGISFGWGVNTLF